MAERGLPVDSLLVITYTDRAAGELAGEFPIAFASVSHHLQVLRDAGLVLTSIGYRGKPIAGLPFDETAGVVPNDDGRVIDRADGRPVAGS